MRDILFAVIAAAIIACLFTLLFVPSSRTCAPGSVERLFTDCH